jgi:AraC family transcriptional activator of tynA and feaB
MKFSSAATPIMGSPSPELAVGSCHTTQVRGFRPWKDFVHDNFPWLEHRDHSDGEFRAEVSAFRLGNGALTTINASASEVIRTGHLVEKSESGFIKLIWQMSGGLRLEQDNRKCMLDPGQTTVCDTTRPYRISLSDGAHLAVLMLPHDACPGWERISQKICGARLGDSATMRAAFGAMMALTGVQNEGANGTTETVLRAVQWMITTALHRSVSELTIGNLHNIRLNKAQQHILDHIADPELDADELAGALCMSRRSLYMLFKEYRLTPGKMIHDLRLERSRQALGDVAQQHRKITEIAFDHGFNDYATFSRLFKTHYGLTPSEYRLKARAPR